MVVAARRGLGAILLLGGDSSHGFPVVSRGIDQPMQSIIKRESDQRPHRVDATIDERRCPVRHKGLVKFIGERIDSCHQYYVQRGPSRPAESVFWAEGAIKEQREDGVLRHVCALPHQEMDAVKGFRGYVHMKDLEKVSKDPCGEGRGESTGRRAEDQSRPEKRERPPEEGLEAAGVQACGGIIQGGNWALLW